MVFLNTSAIKNIEHISAILTVLDRHMKCQERSDKLWKRTVNVYNCQGNITVINVYVNFTLAKLQN